MRKIIIISKKIKHRAIMLTVGAVCCGVPNIIYCQKTPVSQPALESPFVHNRISVNGLLDEWTEYQSIEFPPPNPESKNTYKAQVKTAWDEEKLYLAFRVKDKNLIAYETSDAGTPWRDDAVEVYLSIAPENVLEGKLSPNEFQFIVNLNGTVGSCRGTTLGSRDHSWDADILSGIQLEGDLNKSSGILDQGYTVEIAIFWKTLGIKAQSDIELVVDFAVINRTNDNTTKPNLFVYDWSGLERFGNPAQWHRLVLRRAPLAKSNDLFAEETNWIGEPVWLIVICGLVVIIWIGYSKTRKRLDNNSQPEADFSPTQLQNTPKSSSNIKVSEGLQILAKRVKQILSEDYATELSASGVAKKLRVSERHMRRALKRVDGQNFSKTLQDIRLKKACQLLEESNLSISEIALEVGFGEQSYFARLFKIRHSISPSEYRARFTKDNL